jgi:hypothetical protein
VLYNNKLCGLAPDAVAALCSSMPYQCHGVAELPACPSPIVLARGFAVTPALFATQQADDVVLDSSMLVSVHGTVAVMDGTFFYFDGLPGASAVVITPLIALVMRGEMNVSVTASFLTNTSDAVLDGFSDGKFRHLFNFGGLTCVLNGDRLWVGSSLGGSTNCGAGADITGGADGRGPSWHVDQTRTITVRVSAAGEPSILIDGVPTAAPPPAAHTGADEPAANCQPPVVQPAVELIFGSSGNTLYDDKFHGSMSNITFHFSG